MEILPICRLLSVREIPELQGLENDHIEVLDIAIERGAGDAVNTWFTEKLDAAGSMIAPGFVESPSGKMAITFEKYLFKIGYMCLRVQDSRMFSSGSAELSDNQKDEVDGKIKKKCTKTGFCPHLVICNRGFIKKSNHQLPRKSFVCLFLLKIKILLGSVDI